MNLRGCNKKVIIWPRCASKSLGPIWLPQCQYDLEARLCYIINVFIILHELLFDNYIYKKKVFPSFEPGMLDL